MILVQSIKETPAFLQQTEAVARRYSLNKVFLKMSQKSQENTCAKVSF